MVREDGSVDCVFDVRWFCIYFVYVSLIIYILLGI